MAAFFTGSQTEQDERDFEEWAKESDRHKAFVDRLLNPEEYEENRRALDKFQVEEAWSKMDKRIGDTKVRKLSSWRSVVRYAAVVLVLLSAGVYYWWNGEEVREEVPVLYQIAAGTTGARLTLGDGSVVDVLKDRAVELKEVDGTVRLDGQALKAKQRNKASFCVMQDVNHQLFSDSVWNECELAQPDCPPERIEEILRSFDLLDFKDRHPMALSGGQKQRLAVATAILSDKDVLVFDEPTSGLDYNRMLEVSNMIRKLNDENKVIIIVSHDFEFLGRTCDKIFDMEGCSKESLQIKSQARNRT